MSFTSEVMRLDFPVDSSPTIAMRTVGMLRRGDSVVVGVSSLNKGAVSPGKIFEEDLEQSDFHYERIVGVTAPVQRSSQDAQDLKGDQVESRRMKRDENASSAKFGATPSSCMSYALVLLLTSRASGSAKPRR